jgi:hypothetical protein
MGAIYGDWQSVFCRGVDTNLLQNTDDFCEANSMFNKILLALDHSEKTPFILEEVKHLAI